MSPIIKHLMASTNPADLTPITESINGTWVPQYAENTYQFMQKRRAGAYRDQILMNGLQTFQCDGKKFSQVQKLYGRDVDTMHCEIGKMAYEGDVRVWSYLRNNVLTSNRVEYLGGHKTIYHHENRSIIDGKLYITNHFNQKIRGKMEKCECLRVFERVPELAANVYEVSKKQMEEIPKTIEQMEETSMAPAELVPIDDDELEEKEEKEASDFPINMIPTESSEAMIRMIADGVPEHLAASWQAIFNIFTPWKMPTENKEEVTEVVIPKVSSLTNHSSSSSSEALITMVAEKMVEVTPTMAEQIPEEDSKVTQVPMDIPISNNINGLLIWNDHSLINQVLTNIQPDPQVTINGSWKLHRVYGWADFMAAGRIDQELMWAASNISISSISDRICSFYSTTSNAMDHLTLDTLDEPMDQKNGTTKITFLESKILTTITRDSKTKEEISRMIRYIEDGKLVSEYQCGEYHFEVHHEKA